MNSAIRKSARGEMCTLRLDWCCNGDSETTVLAHVGNHGSAKRNHDEDGIYACHECHAAIDFRTPYLLDDDEDQQRKMHIVRDLCIRNALARTRVILRKKGLMQ